MKEEKLSTLIVNYRIKANLNQKEFAKLLNMSNVTISKAELEKPISKISNAKIRLYIKEHKI